MRLSVGGTVTSIKGTTLTVTAHKMGWGRYDNELKAPAITSTPITYTVDASTATVVKSGVTSTFTNIAVGDTVKIQGTITGTNIVATVIHANVARPAKTPKPVPSPLILGNGQPVIAGTITGISGTILTVTNKSNIVYTVDVSAAKIQNNTLSDMTIGDSVVIQGAINGTSVTAYSIIIVQDQGSTPNPSVRPNDNGNEARGNFFGGVSRFFQRFFGF